jgi:hypothetical protein
MFDLRQLLMGAITLGVIAVAGGCGGGTPTVPTTTHQPSPAPLPSGGTQLYEGQAFSIAYPAGWWVYAAEQPKSFGTDTTIVDPADHARLVRVEVRARGARRTPAAGRHVSFQGHDALRTQFRVRRNGRTLRGEELVFRDAGGRRIVILTQAPAAQYGAWSRRFAGARDSFLSY